MNIFSLRNLFSRCKTSSNSHLVGVKQTIIITMVQNEADIIEYFVRLNAQHADHILIILNPSTDGTEQIIDELIRENFPLIKWKRPINFYEQSNILSLMAMRVRDFFGDVSLIFLDADELLRTHHNASIENDIAHISCGQIGIIPWKTYLPKKSNHATHGLLDLQRWDTRLETEVEQFYKIVIPRSTQLSRGDCISRGAHSVIDAAGNNLPTLLLNNTSIAHLPVRSIRQLRHKILGGLLCKTIAYPDFWHTNESYHWKNVFRLLEKGDAVTLEDVAKCYLLREIPDTIYTSHIPSVIDPLPAITLKYNKLIKKSDAEFMMFHRIKDSIINSDDMCDYMSNIICRTQTNRYHAYDNATCDSECHLQQDDFDWPPFSGASYVVNPKTVIHMGCGCGSYLAAYQMKGASVRGIDGSDWTSQHLIPKENYIKCDLTSNLPDHIESADLSICVDVLERLPLESGRRIIKLLSSITKKAIIFSSVQKNRPGHGHITSRDPELWLKELDKLGWTVDYNATVGMRMLATLHWYKRNLFLLRRKTEFQVMSSDRLAFLLDRTKQTDSWPDQSQTSPIFFPGTAESFSLCNNEPIPVLPDAAFPGRMLKKGSPLMPD